RRRHRPAGGPAMAGHQLTDAYLGALARRLPADVVDELADGLTEAYLRHVSSGLDRDAAAGAAVAEFGEPDEVVAAFVQHSPGPPSPPEPRATAAGSGPGC